MKIKKLRLKVIPTDVDVEEKKLSEIDFNFYKAGDLICIGKYIYVFTDN